MEEDAYLEANTVSMVWLSASSWDMAVVSTMVAKLAKPAECGRRWQKVAKVAKGGESGRFLR